MTSDKSLETHPDEFGGDSVCWLNRVCPECGRLNGAPHPVTCEACGAAFPPPE